MERKTARRYTREARRLGRTRRIALAGLAGLLATTGTVLLSIGVATAAPPTSLYQESFQNKTVTSPIVKPRPTAGSNFACLTASGDQGQLPIKSCSASATDAEGSGALRLTPASGGQVGGAFYKSSVAATTAAGLDLGFTAYQYGSSSAVPADGISFSLAAVDPDLQEAPANLGPVGGNLGYNGHTGGTTPGDGLAHGYLGIGFDTQGNYANAAEFDSATCGANPAWATQNAGAKLFPDAVTVRGPGNLRNGYCLLNSSLNDPTFNNPDRGGNATANDVPTSRYTDGSTTNGSTTFTSATANFTANDIGAAIVETDSTGSIQVSGSGLTYSTITAVTNATTVTLSQPATATNAGIDFYVGRTRLYRTGTARPAGTAVEIAINPLATPTNTAGINGLTAQTVPARSYLVTYKSSAPGTTQRTIIGALPTSSNSLIPAGAIPSAWINPLTGIPYQLSFGWSASTGTNNSFNEVNQTAARSLDGAPPVFTLTTTDRTAGNFNGNFSGDGPGNVASGTIFYDGGLSNLGDAATQPVLLSMRTSPGLQITGGATGTGWTCAPEDVAVVLTTGSTTSGSATLTATGANFTQRDLGKRVIALDGQGAIADSTTIAAVVNATTITLSQSAAATTAAANLIVGVGALSRYTDGVATSGSATFTSATAGFVAGDVGSLLVETDAQGAIVNQTKITAVGSSTSVTLSKNAASSATAVAFEVLRNSTSTQEWSARCTRAGTLAAGSTYPRLGLPVMIADATRILTPVSSGVLSSPEGNSAFAADPGISTSPYQRLPTPVFTGPFPQAGPSTGTFGVINGHSGLAKATLTGGNLDALTSVSWGSATLTTACAAPGCYEFDTNALFHNASQAQLNVDYPTQTLAGSATPTITLTNANGSTTSGQPFTYYAPPTLVTTRGPAGQNATDGSEPATITGTNLSGTTVVYWGDSQLDIIALGACPTVKWNCFEIVSNTELTVYPPGENDPGTGVDFRIDPGTTPTQPAHMANVSLDTAINGVALSFEDFASGNTAKPGYLYLPTPTATSPSSSGPQAGGTRVDIVGSGFAPSGTPVVTKVELKFGGTTYNVTTTCSGGATTNCFTVNNNTSLTYYTPVSATDDNFTVRVYTPGIVPGGTAPSPGIHDYTPSPTAVGTGTGPTTGGTTVTITGTLLNGTSGITIGGTTLTECLGALATGCYIVDNATTIRLKTPVHAAGGVPIVVTVGGFGPITAGTFTYVASGGGGGGGGGPTTTTTVPTTGPTFTRIAGPDRAGTAAEVAMNLFPNGDAPLVVLAREDIFADGLTGSPMAYGLGGPVMLTTTNKLSASTDAAITKVLQPHGRIYVLGGVHAVAANVESGLRARGYTVERIGGKDRFETAALIANRMAQSGKVLNVYLATGVKFGDAISAANVASLNDGVVLLTNEGQMPKVTDTWMKAHSKAPVTAVGAPAAAAVGGKGASIVGIDTFETSTKVARAAYPQPTGVVIATGTTFPDALAGAVYAAFKRLPQILVNPTATKLDTEQDAYLTGAEKIKSVVALGGPAAVPERTVDLVRNAVSTKR